MRTDTTSPARMFERHHAEPTRAAVALPTAAVSGSGGKNSFAAGLVMKNIVAVSPREIMPYATCRPDVVGGRAGVRPHR